MLLALSAKFSIRMLARSVAFPALVLHPVGTLLHFTESLEERRGTKGLLD